MSQVCYCRKVRSRRIARAAYGLELSILALCFMGCAVKKKPLPPITGPVEVRIQEQNCKALGYPYPPDSRICDKAKLIPLTVKAK